MLVGNAPPEHVQHSIVLLWEPTKLKPISLREVEAKVGTVNSVAPLMGPGGGSLIRIARHHHEVLLLPDRCEITARGEEPTRGLAQGLAESVSVFTNYVETPTLRAMGYNYNVVFDLADHKTAIRAIADSTVTLASLKKRVKYPVEGAASWLYFGINDKALWLRLEPRGGDKSTSRLWVYGNFNVEMKATLPPENKIVDEFSELYEVFSSIISAL